MENTSAEIVDGPKRDWSMPGGIALIVVLGVIAFVAYRWDKHDASADQVAAVAQTFIQSSPVLQLDLGKVTSIKQTAESRQEGAKPFWLVDYAVTGTRHSGEVEMHLHKSAGEWNVPVADLHMANQRPINLR